MYKYSYDNTGYSPETRYSGKIYCQFKIHRCIKYINLEPHLNCWWYDPYVCDNWSATFFLPRRFTRLASQDLKNLLDNHSPVQFKKIVHPGKKFLSDRLRRCRVNFQPLCAFKFNALGGSALIPFSGSLAFILGQ